MNRHNETSIRSICDILGHDLAGRPALEAVIRAHRDDIESEWGILGGIAAMTESPIEVGFMAGLIRVCKRHRLGLTWKHKHGSISTLFRAPDDTWMVNIMPQSEIGPYRVDFKVLAFKPSEITTRRQIVIECDGKDFHTDQERERTRDDYLKKQGYAVLHFMGSTLHANAVECAESVVEELA